MTITVWDSERAFWQEVYITAMKMGKNPISEADVAIKELRLREPKGPGRI